MYARGSVEESRHSPTRLKGFTAQYYRLIVPLSYGVCMRLDGDYSSADSVPVNPLNTLTVVSAKLGQHSRGMLL
jgi:dethiobiotin synthetase